MQLNPGCAFFKGPHSFLFLIGVAFKAEFTNKKITKAHLELKKDSYAFNRGHASNPGAFKRGSTVYFSFFFMMGLCGSWHNHKTLKNGKKILLNDLFFLEKCVNTGIRSLCSHFL